MVNGKEPRLSLQSLRVLDILLEHPTEGLAGVDIRRLTGLASGTLYPILGRFEAAGWLESWWEEVNPKEAGRPRKRLYCLTMLGARSAVQAFQQFDRRVRPIPAWV